MTDKDDTTSVEELKRAVMGDDEQGILDRAVTYARYGLRVFPVEHSPDNKSRDKAPMPGYAWKMAATSKINEVVEDFTYAIDQWGEDHVHVAWALGLDDHVAIDMDVPEAEWPSWTADIVDSAAINWTARGQHLIFKNPPGLTPGNETSRFPTQGWGEVRGAGGYIIIAGPDRPGLDVNDLDLAMPFPKPGWLAPYGGGADAVTSAEVVEFAKQHTEAGSPGKLKGLSAMLRQKTATIRHGDPVHGRHPFLVYAACLIAEEAQAGYYPFDQARQMLHDWWRSVAEPERHGREFENAIAWGIGRARLSAGSGAAGTTDPADSPHEESSRGGDDETDRSIQPLDWEAFWAADRTEDDWFIEGFWPRGRAMVLHAKAKEGKSEFVLFCVLCLVRGVDPWTGERVEPRTVCYFDFEMTEDDLMDRLIGMGLSPDADLSRLRYYLLPALAPLDTPKGAQELLAIMERDQPDAVVIDTFGRAVEGEEDVADTVRNFYRLTGLSLKAKGIGYLRTDHTGKDATKGQRGSSAKNDDVDIIWSMSRTSTGMKLSCRSRVSWVPETLLFARTDDPTVRYERVGDLIGDDLAIAGKAAELDQLGIPLDWGRDKVVKWMASHGHAPGKNDTLSAALKRRRQPGYSGARRLPGVEEASHFPARPLGMKDGPDDD